MKESERLHNLIELLLSDGLELTPWTINALSKTSRDTFESFIIFADAARTDPNVSFLILVGGISKVDLYIFRCGMIWFGVFLGCFIDF